jgi:hypothetical protein
VVKTSFHICTLCTVQYQQLLLEHSRMFQQSAISFFLFSRDNYGQRFALDQSTLAYMFVLQCTATLPYPSLAYVLSPNRSCGSFKSKSKGFGPSRTTLYAQCTYLQLFVLYCTTYWRQHCLIRGFVDTCEQICERSCEEICE